MTELNHLSPIEREAKELVEQGRSHRAQDLRYLAQTFISRRMANSDTMEKAKLTALNLLIKQMDDNPDKLSPTKLLEIIDIISNHTGSDLKLLIDAQASLSANVGAAGKKNPTTSSSSILGSMFDMGSGDRAPVGDAGSSVRRESYKTLDGLVQVAESVIEQSQNAES